MCGNLFDKSSTSFISLLFLLLYLAGVPSSVTAPASNSVTNTRQLGMKKTIELTRGGKGTFGFGLASRDVATNTDDIPIYVKSITTDGPAFHDGRLKIGDRILEVRLLTENVANA